VFVEELWLVIGTIWTSPTGREEEEEDEDEEEEVTATGLGIEEVERSRAKISSETVPLSGFFLFQNNAARVEQGKR
jgi:hypothetical protein